MSEREAVKRKIVALLNKTIEAGASEHEALMATEKAQELMAHFDIHHDELDFKQKNIITKSLKLKLYNGVPIVRYSSIGVAKLCQTRVYENNKQDHFIGFEWDVKMAIHLLDYLQHTVERLYTEYKNSAEYDRLSYHQHGLSIMTSYIYGVDTSLQSRLMEQAKERNRHVETETGRSLVPMKDAAINAHMEDIGLRLTRSRMNRSIRSTHAFSKGRSDGEKVNLQNAVEGEGLSAVKSLPMGG